MDEGSSLPCSLDTAVFETSTLTLDTRTPDCHPWGHQDGRNKKTGYVVAAPTCGAHGWHRQAVRGSLQGSIHSPKNPQGTGGGELGKRWGRGKENSFPRARSYSKQNSWKAQARCSQSTRKCWSLETVLGLQRSALPGWLLGWRA